jgi:hypothetical protein
VNVNIVDVNLADRMSGPGGYGYGRDSINMAEHSATQINVSNHIDLFNI